MTETRHWIVQASGQGYYALLENIGETFRVGPWGSKEKAKDYIDENGNDSLEEIRLFQYQNFDIAQNNG